MKAQEPIIAQVTFMGTLTLLGFEVKRSVVKRITPTKATNAIITNVRVTSKPRRLPSAKANCPNKNAINRKQYRFIVDALF